MRTLLLYASWVFSALLCSFILTMSVISVGGLPSHSLAVFFGLFAGILAVFVLAVAIAKRT
jgi:hypothetical protein